MADDLFLIEKRGLYYCPDARGYTGLKRAAGRYSLDEVALHFPNFDSPNQDGMRFIAEQNAPQFSTACPWDLRLKEKTRIAAFEEAAFIARNRWRAWKETEPGECNVECDVTACSDIAEAILAHIED